MFTKEGQKKIPWGKRPSNGKRKSYKERDGLEPLLFPENWVEKNHEQNLPKSSI